MRINGNPVVAYGNVNVPQQAIHRSCDELYDKTNRDKGGAPQLLMLINRGKSPIMYEIVKQYVDTVKGVQSQVIDAFNA